jgi:anti-sigma factor (TIGR02949 family)
MLAMTTDLMTCDDALDGIEPFLDGELPPEEAERLRSHLAGCRACAGELALAERIQRELRALPQPDCPPEVIERVVRAGRGEVVPFPARPSGLRVRIAAAAAVLALAVGGGSLFLHVQQQQEERPSPEQVAEATREARLALAYLGRATRKAGFDVRDEVLEKRLVIPATRSVSRSLGEIPDETRKESR